MLQMTITNLGQLHMWSSKSSFFSLLNVPHVLNKHMFRNLYVVIIINLAFQLISERTTIPHLVFS